MTSARHLPARVLLTGGGGFVGSHLRAALREYDPSSTIIGVGLRGDTVQTAVDLTDAAAVDAFVKREQPDAVIHLAAQASVGASLGGAATRTWAVNLGGTLNLALAVSRHAPTATVLFASSSEIYGRAFAATPITEDATPNPVNDYARSKLMAEQVLAQVLPLSARLVVARPFNHTGPGQSESFVLPSFAGQIARIEAGQQAPVLRVGNLDAQRDFLDVRDVAAAYIALLAAAPRLPPRFICNIATGSAQPLRAVLDILRGLARVPFTLEIDPVRLRSSDIPYAAGCTDCLATATGWMPAIPLKETLSELLDEARRRVAAGF